MKKFLSKLFLFILMMFCLCSVLNYGIGKYNNTPLHYGLQYDEVINHKANANCIILGTSHAVHSIRPSYLNTEKNKFYNLAFNGSNPRFFLQWYQNFFMKYYRVPEYCIFSVDWFMFDEKYLWRRYEQDAIYFPDTLLLSSLLNVKEFKTKMLIENRYPFFVHKTFDDLIRLKNKVHGDSEYVISEFDDGYVPYEIPYKKKYFSPPLKIKVDSNLLNDFDSLIRIIQAKGTKIIFVNTPEYQSSSNEFKNKTAIIFIEETAKKYQIPFLNYNTTNRSEINDNIENFIDWGHMSRAGSKKFSLQLKNDLQKIMN